jgi:hypothetical protein
MKTLYNRILGYLNEHLSTITIVLFVVALAMSLVFWGFINKNSAGVQAITTLVLILVTALYSIYTRKMLSIMMTEQESKFVPDIAIRFVKRSTILFQIEIENISKVEIFNLKFEKYPDIPITDIIKSSNMGFFLNGISYLGVGQKYDSLFIDFAYLASKNLNSGSLDFIITYVNNKNRNFKKEISFNLNMLSGLIPDSSMNDELKDINKNLKKISEKIK